MLDNAFLKIGIAVGLIPLAVPKTAWELTRKARFYVEHASHSRSPLQFSDEFDVVGSRENPRGRVYMFHGLRADRSYWFQPDHIALTKRLEADGFQLILLTLPYAHADFFTDDDGKSYCDQFSAWFERMRATTEKSLGFSNNESVVGASWGGWHALVAAQHRGIQSYVAVNPVVDIARLSEFWMASNRSCDPVSGAMALAEKPGLLLWGTIDERVDFRKTVELAISIRPWADGRLTTIVYEGIGHQTTVASNDSVANWQKAVSVRGHINEPTVSVMARNMESDAN
jgi:hypothetical protein